MPFCDLALCFAKRQLALHKTGFWWEKCLKGLAMLGVLETWCHQITRQIMVWSVATSCLICNFNFKVNFAQRIEQFKFKIIFHSYETVEKLLKRRIIQARPYGKLMMTSHDIQCNEHDSKLPNCCCVSPFLSLLKHFTVENTVLGWKNT